MAGNFQEAKKVAESALSGVWQQVSGQDGGESHLDIKNEEDVPTQLDLMDQLH